MIRNYLGKETKVGYWNRVLSQRIARRRALALAGAGLTGAALLAACGGDDADDAAGPTSAAGATSAPGTAAATSTPGTAAGTPQRGGRLVFPTRSGQLKNWNPVSDNAAAGMAGSNAYDRLLSTTLASRGFKLEAAASVEIPDATTVIFKLRPGMVYQDVPPVNGRALKADDVVQTQIYVKDLTTAFDNGFQRNFLGSISAPDDQTVVLELSQPDAYLFSSSHLGTQSTQHIIPPETFDGLDDKPWIGSGPYQLAEHSFGNRWLFERFDNYRGAGEGLPYIDEREYIVIDDNTALQAALLGGQIHYLGFIGTLLNYNTIADLADSSGGKITLETAPGLNPMNLYLNMAPQAPDFPWKTDIRVRQAFWRLTDKEQMLQLVYAGNGLIPTGLLPNGINKAYQLDAEESAEYFKYDVQEAKQLLDAASFDLDREWETTHAIPGSVNQVAGEVWQQQVAKVGMKTKVVPLPFGTWLQDKIASANYEIIVDEVIASDSPGFFLRLLHSDPRFVFKFFGLYDPQIDALIEKSEITTDFEENVKLVKEIQLESLKLYSSVYFLNTVDFFEAYDSRLQNMETSPLSIAKYRAGAWFKS